MWSMAQNYLSQSCWQGSYESWHWPYWTWWFNSLAPGMLQRNFRQVIFKLNWVIYGCGISWEVVLTWMAMDLTDDKSALVQVMAWCRQATSHYLSQCWPRSVLPYGITRPQCVEIMHKMFNSLKPGNSVWHYRFWSTLVQVMQCST